MLLLEEAFNIFILARSVWFLAVLFFSIIVFILCVWISEKWRFNIWIETLVCYIILVLVLPNNLFSLYKFKWLFPFMIMGYAYGESKLILDCKWKNLLKKYGMISGVLFLLVCAVFGNQLNEAFIISIYGITCEKVIYCFINVFTGVLGIGAILYISDILSHTRMRNMLADMGKYTMDVYVIHMFLVYAIIGVMQEKYVASLFWNFVSALLAIGITIGIALFSKYCLRKIRLYQISVGM